MLGSPLLDVAIGLVLVYLLLSLICSAINELLEGWMKNRASDLERGIRELLGHPATGSPAREDLSSYATKIYQHPLVASLYQGKYVDGKLPSYIPSRTFALALMDIALPPRADQPGGAAGAAGVAPAAEGGGAPHPVAALRVAVAQIDNAQVRGALLPLIDAAGADAVRVRENIEGWYNTSMDRVSGWYKRRTHIIVFVIGLVIAAALNVDTISITRRLGADEKLRSAMVDAAAATVKENPIGADSGKTPEQKVEAQLKELNAIAGLPIGWSSGAPPLSADGATQVLQALPGWLITAFAVSLGAPFWFDLLNKFMVVRSTVKPHEKSPEEKSND